MSMSGMSTKVSGTAMSGRHIPHTTMSHGRLLKSHCPFSTSVLIPAASIANTPNELDSAPPRLLKLARMANVVASMFFGHILLMSTVLGMNAIMITMGSKMVSPIR